MMSDEKKLIDESPIVDTPVVPNQLEGDAVIQFRCHKDIDCFNACCKNIDIMLTPYDILRLKQRLGITSTEFLRQYTEPFEFARGQCRWCEVQTQGRHQRVSVCDRRRL